MTRYSLLFLTGLAAAEAWSGIGAPSARPGLRTSHESCGTQAPAMALDAMGSVDTRFNRRSLLEFAGQAGIAPAIISVAFPSSASAETVDKETAEAVAKIPLSVLKAIAGGSDKEFKSLQANYETDLKGLEANLFQVYMYGADKLPATEDPRASLRPLFQSRMSDGLIKFAEANGISPKVYDARGDGLTNTGKGGVLKGSKVLLEGFKKKGLLEDFTLDTSAHDENAWQQGIATSSISVVVKKPVGIAAKAALDEYEDPIELSLVGNALSGYMRQCKVVSDFNVEPMKDGEKINFKLSWAGKARLAKDIERRANDKFNTARAFKKEDKKAKKDSEDE